jgi:hypothetical protein
MAKVFVGPGDDREAESFETSKVKVNPFRALTWFRWSRGFLHSVPLPGFGGQGGSFILYATCGTC